MSPARASTRRGDLSLVVKELTELAARRRTYIVRTVYAALLFILFGLVLYSEVSRLGGASHLVLGVGGRLFRWVFGLQVAGIYLFLPALAAGAIAEEKEKRTLELLLITDLTPGEIVLQKLVGRLMPMLTLLTLAVPLMTVCYAYGGLSGGEVLVAALALVVTCVEVGAFTVMTSAKKRTAGEALSATYANGFGLLFLFSLISGFVTAIMAFAMMGRGGGGVFAALAVGGFGLMPAGALGAYAISGLGPALVSLLPAGLWVLLMLARARKHLVKCAFLPPRKRAKGWSASIEQLFSGTGPARATRAQRKRYGFPEDRPIVWREVGRSLLRWPRPFVQTAVAMEIVALVLCFAFARRPTYADGAVAITFWIAILWIAAGMAVTGRAAVSLASERANRTMEVLITTPLSGAEIVRQKLEGARRLGMLFAFPLVTLMAMEALLETNLYPAARQVGYFLVAAASVFVLLGAFTWVSLFIGLKTRSASRAALLAMGALIAWNVGPPLFTGWVEDLSGGARWSWWLGMLSPAVLISYYETGFRFVYQGLHGLAPAVFGLALNAGILLGARRLCLRNADRHLGRPAVIPLGDEGAAAAAHASGGAA